MRLCRFELQKLFGRKYMLTGLVLILVANLFLLSIATPNQSVGLSGSYRELMSDLDGLTLEQQRTEIRERYDTVYAFLRIENFLGTDAAYATREEFIQLYREYGALYEAKSLKLYTDNLMTELQFLATVRSELETVADYPAFLQSVQEQADLYGRIPIFNQSDSFDRRNVEKTAADYRRLSLSNITIDYYPQKGVLTAITFEYTDILILVCMLLFAGVLITSERESGMLHYIKSTPKGRASTAVAKCFALVITTLAVVLLLYGSNLIYCAVTYGLGDLGRSIQSLPFLMRSVLPLSLFQYLLLFLAAKWFSAFILGLGVMLIVFCARRFLAGIGVSLLFFGAQWWLYTAIRPNNTTSIIKYINFVGILKVNEWVGGYLNFNIGGHPFPIFLTVLYSALALLLILFIGFVALFSNLTLWRKYAVHAGKGSRRVQPTTLFKEEAHKTFLLGGVGFLLLFCLIFQIWQGHSADSFITAEEIYYRHYMIPISGKYTQDTYAYLQQEEQAFAQSREMDARFAGGELSEEEYTVFQLENYSLYKRRESFDLIIYSKLPYVMNNQGAWLVYETGYEILFDKNDTRDLGDTLVSGFLITICLANLFAQEKQSGMYKILESTPLGRKHVVRKKIGVALIVAVFVTLLVLLPRYIQVVRDFGLPAFFAPAKSLQEYASLPDWIRVFSVALFSFAARLITNAFLAIVVLTLSKKTGSALAAAFIGLLLFCVPPVLALFYFEPLKLLTAYPLFHLSQIVVQAPAFAFAVLLCCNFILYGVFFTKTLYR